MITFNRFRKPNKKSNKGFTLLELSIVLVIVGFLVAGILIGQDMIEAAKIRALITQFERYNTAVNVFYDKYWQLPGDIPKTTTIRSWIDFFDTPGVDSAQTDQGDGNGYIHKEAGVPGSAGDTNPIKTVFGTKASEIAGFFNHLGALGLIDFYGDVTAPVNAEVGKVLPRSKMLVTGFTVYTGFRSKPFLAAASDPGDVRNYWHIGVADNLLGNEIRVQDALTQRQAYNFDRKTDDGMPTTGAVMTFGDANTSPEGMEVDPTISGASTADKTCVEGVATVPNEIVYKISSNFPACQLRYRVMFP